MIVFLNHGRQFNVVNRAHPCSEAVLIALSAGHGYRLVGGDRGCAYPHQLQRVFIEVQKYCAIYIIVGNAVFFYWEFPDISPIF